MSLASPLGAFDPLPLKERLFVRARLFSAPLTRVVARAPPGRIVDIGCGHGLVVALLARPDREVVGLDPDPRKIEWARASVGASPRVRLEVGTVQELAVRESGTFDAALVCDVLYLLPQSDWSSFLTATRALLKPGGVLLLKEAEADRASWRYWKCLAQERLMVEVLRRTKSSGGLGFVSRAEMVRHLQDAGFSRVDSTSMGKGYTTPHVLFTARTS